MMSSAARAEAWLMVGSGSEGIWDWGLGGWRSGALHLSLGRGQSREGFWGGGTALWVKGPSPHPLASLAGLSQGRGEGPSRRGAPHPEEPPQGGVAKDVGKAPPLEIPFLLLLLHRRRLVVVDDAALSFRRGRDQHFLDDLRQRRRGGAHGAGQRVAAERPEADDLHFRLFAGLQRHPLVVDHDRKSTRL